MRFDPTVWIPVLKRVYPEIQKETPVALYGSQIIYAVVGVAFESKDIDLLIPQPVSPTIFIEAYRRAFGESEARLEVISRKIDHAVYHIFTSRGVAVEVFALPSECSPFIMFPDELLYVERDGVKYWSFTLEAYAVMEASRSDAPREEGVRRFAEISQLVNWEKVEKLAGRANVEGAKIRKFIELVNEAKNRGAYTTT
jgi:predicted nucleotidyltransferase